MQRLTPVLAKTSGISATGLSDLKPPAPDAAALVHSLGPSLWREPMAPVAAPEALAAFAPMGYESGYDYPLMVWLHGEGADEECLPEVMRHVSVRNFVAVAPRGVVDRDTGYGWSQTLDAIAAAEDAVFEGIEAAASRFGVNRDRVFLAGAGAGGTMAMRIALSHPGRFAGVATLDGSLPIGHTPLHRVNDLRDTPLLLSASKDSPAYGEAAVGADLRLLHSAGCRVAIRQYPGDDDLTDTMLGDLNRWAMEIVCG